MRASHWRRLASSRAQLSQVLHVCGLQDKATMGAGRSTMAPWPLMVNGPSLGESSLYHRTSLFVPPFSFFERAVSKKWVSAATDYWRECGAAPQCCVLTSQLHHGTRQVSISGQFWVRFLAPLPVSRCVSPSSLDFRHRSRGLKCHGVPRI